MTPQTDRMFSAIRDRLEMMIPPLPQRPSRLVKRGPELVVLLHGLWRAKGAMAPMERALHRADFSTLNLPYPSFRMPLEDLAEDILNQIQNCAADFDSIHIVTHSLGGVLVREVLARAPEKLAQRIVMLAPPSAGSDVIEWAGESIPLKYFLGPAGCALTVNNCVEKIPFFSTAPAGIRCCIVAGSSARIPGLQWLLREPNDGIVTVKRCNLPWAEEFHTVPADHTFIMAEKAVQDLTLSFLKKP